MTGNQSYVIPTWPAPKNIHAYTTTRQGGFSSQPFASFSFNFKDGDDPAAIRKNCLKLAEELQLPTDPSWLKQLHTNIVVNANDSSLEIFPIADAIYSKSNNVVCAVRTADCLPILICDSDATVVAGIHAGWKGIAQGIIENTLNTINVDPKKILVWFGPAIGPNKFEVGEDVRGIFLKHDSAAQTAFLPGTSPNKWLANIYSLAKLRFLAKGVTAIYGGEYCTFTQKDLFFSYRRDNHVTGHMASLIWRS